MTGMMENAFINGKNKSKIITAEVEVPASGAIATMRVPTTLHSRFA